MVLTQTPLPSGRSPSKTPFHGTEQTIRFATFCFCCFCFVYFTLMLDQPAWDLKVLNGHQVFQNITSHSQTEIDVVLIPPFVETFTQGGAKDKSTNYSVLSVFRFMPWVRRVHMFDPNAPKDLIEHWSTHQKSPFVTFHQPIVEYSLTSPFLAEKFIVLHGEYMVTNYVFPWQFFVDNSPIIRKNNTGLTPFTRAIMNENVYVQNGIFGRPENKVYQYAVWKGLRTGKIEYAHNRDHLSMPCPNKEVASTRRFSSFTADELIPYLKFEKVHKRRKSPFEMVLCVTYDTRADLTFTLPEKYQTAIHMWVIVRSHTPVHERISIAHRMKVQENLFIELDPSKFENKAESLGAEVVKRIKRLTNDPDAIRVVEVYGHEPYQEKLTNQVANKLAQFYQSAFSTFVTTHPTDQSERLRLSRL